MSFADSIVYNKRLRSVFKFIFALSIPLAIGWFFVYSQEQATREVAAYRKEQSVHPTVTGMLINDYQLKEVDDNNVVHWQLVAKQGFIAPNNKDVFLDDVVVDRLDGTDVKMHIVAPKGQANQITHYVKLISTKSQTVLAQGDNGKNIVRAKILELITKDQFVATDDVSVEWLEKAKVTGNSATGLIENTGINNVKIVGNTHSVIAMK